MNRRALLLLICCILMAFPALGEGAADSSPALEPKLVVDESLLEARAGISDALQESLRTDNVKIRNVSPTGMSIPVTTDQVSVGPDGELTVVTGDVSLSVLPPFGMMAFGQDALVQLDVYAMFDEPGEVVEYMQSIGAHMCIVDLNTGTEIYAMTGSDALSSIVEDIDLVSDETLSVLVERLQQANPGADVSRIDCGGHTYIVYDYRRTDSEMIVYSSVKNNTCIDFMLLPGGDAVTDFEINTARTVLSETQVATA